MPVKIRLSRKGSKKKPFYHIIITDSRAPRDGKYIERLGFYNPGTNPATIEINFDRTLEWLQKGAQPTDTCRAILSYKGILMKKHLLEGVIKGVFSEAEAEAKFNAWLEEKESKIQAKKDRITKDRDEKLKKAIEAESKVSEARAVEIAKKNAELTEIEEKTEVTETASEEVVEVTAKIAEEPKKDESSPDEKPEKESAETKTEDSKGKAEVIQVPSEEAVEAATEVAEKPKKDKSSDKGKPEKESTETKTEESSKAKKVKVTAEEKITEPGSKTENSKEKA